MKTPTNETSTRSIGKLSQPSSWRSGIDAINGARARSETSIERRAPQRAITAPEGMPRIATGASSTASTMLIFVGEPVVARTNHGSARNVICEPSAETTCDASSAAIPGARRRLMPRPPASRPIGRPRAG